MSIDSEEIQKSRKLADFYYDNYFKHYLAKEYSKASEFLWGTINNLVYILGLFSNRKISHHDEVVSFIKELAIIKQQNEIFEQLASAERLHANFFHDFMDELMFETDKNRVLKLIEILASIADEKIKSLRNG